MSRHHAFVGGFSRDNIYCYCIHRSSHLAGRIKVGTHMKSTMLYMIGVVVGLGLIQQALIK